jgi:hypothetical protein
MKIFLYLIFYILYKEYLMYIELYSLILEKR